MKIHFTSFRLFAATTIVVVFTCHIASAQSDTELSFHVIKRSPCKRKKQNDLQSENIKGKVKNIITEIYSAEIVPRGSAPVLNQTDTTKYDTLGTMTGKVVKYPKAIYPSRLTRTFDENKNIRTDFFCNWDSTYSVLTEYEYGTDDNLSSVSIENYQSVRGVIRSEKHYDKKGNCIEEILPDGKKLYAYDDKGNCIRYTDMSDSFAENHSITTYLYDENCKHLSSVKIGKDTINTLYRYDNKDSLIEEMQEMPAHTVISHILYEYDDRGNLTKADYTARGGFKKAGMIRSLINKYEYDITGNWTKKTLYLSDQEFMKYERRIIYY